MAVRLDKYLKLELRILSHNHRSCETLSMRIFNVWNCDESVCTPRHVVFKESCLLEFHCYVSWNLQCHRSLLGGCVFHSSRLSVVFRRESKWLHGIDCRWGPQIEAGPSKNRQLLFYSERVHSRSIRQYCHL
jgi:hypothetical protein